MNALGPIPSQAKAFLAGRTKVSTYEACAGTVTAKFVEHNITHLPPIPAGSVIHDNACGSGTVTRVILAASPPDITISATDIDQPFLDALQEDVTTNSWPVQVSNQKSEATSFPDEHFSHSITNIAIFFTSATGLDGAKEVYRTLKPGGYAIVNCWESITWFFPIKLVSEATRGKPFVAPPINWSDGVQIQKIMVEAGFDPEKMKVGTSEAWARTSDLRSWAEKAWAYLAGIGGWQESDEEKWDEAVDMLVEKLRAAPGTKVVDGETWMRASQWWVVARK
ncbi:S-adenosyl-L-methionine-dependent methyltransferase [Amniculicola lignicola CBS 123094]|uniref:S-adenosyl-L-methionine-dependent methyltransferase n=1 Tax=Amniculicola lignicola CBS 123094 TaxID=1392246 RepID=A0A6A5WTH9_9PLEO|nr:S-adenosyl-L-methionine-dependent methyltransferase [Amniculicola lignicola CBS 123094]